MNDSTSDLSPYETFAQPRPLLVVLSGPSGVGKDSTMAGLRERGAEFYQVVTATTRPQRPSEVDGVDYHFLTMQQFAEMIEAQELLEHAIVYGDYKGIPKAEVRKGLRSGLDVVLRVDVQGVETVQRMVPQAVTIFLIASSDEEMVRRLRDRRTENEGMLAMRVATAREELRRVETFKYVVVNREDALDDTVDQVLAIMTAERCRVDWQPVAL
ncbi:MAG: guanylate kinase [Caldilineales bacterium]